MRVVGGRIGRLIVDARAIINNLAATQSERAGRSRFREDTREKHDGSLLLPALINPRAPPLSFSLSLSLSLSPVPRRVVALIGMSISANIVPTVCVNDRSQSLSRTVFGHATRGSKRPLF